MEENNEKNFEEEDVVEVIDAEEEKDFESMYNEMLDKYQRSLAEFDNYRKRTSKEMMARYEEGMKAAAAKFLPSLDNLERAIHTGMNREDKRGREAALCEAKSSDENKDDTFYQGIALILRGLEAAFGDMDIKPIDLAPGAPFNANFHNAVAHTEDENFGENQIAEVLQKGYMFKDKVLRHAMVKVAN